MRKMAAALATLSLVGLVRADAPPPPPFVVPLFDGKDGRSHAIPMEGFKDPATPSPLKLMDMVMRCYPQQSWFRPELRMEARAGHQTGDSTATTIYDSSTGTTTTTANRYIGLVASIPLYSAIEVNNEREKEAKRRIEVATAVGSFTQALATYAKTARMLSIAKPLERRAQERVITGVAMAAEQVAAMQQVATLEGDLWASRAAITANRLTLVGMCEEGERADTVDRYLQTLLPDDKAMR